MTELIGLNGFKTAGKDTVCAYIKELLRGKRVQRVGFADKLKVMAARALGYEGSDELAIELMNECKEHWDFDVVSRTDGHFTTFTGRAYLQWFGGGAREVFGDTFWIDQVLPPVGKTNFANGAVYPDADLVVITDVRYANEAQRVHECGGEVWEIIRPGLESDGHGSEQPLPRELVDRTLLNDSGLIDLRQLVEAELLSPV